MLRALLIPLSGSIIALLLLLAGYGFLDADLSLAGATARLLGAAAAIILVVITARVVWRSSATDLDARLWPVAAAALLGAVGAATVLGTVSLGQSTGDWEYYGIALGIAMMAQACLVALVVLRASRSANRA